MMPEENAPIACTLGAGEFRERLAWIAALRRDALLKWTWSGLTLTLCFAPHATERVHELMRREQACCPFLRFELQEQAGEVRLVVTVPEGARLMGAPDDERLPESSPLQGP